MKKKFLTAGVLALSLLFPGTALAGPISSGWYTIQTKSSALNRVSVEDSNSNTNAKIQKANNQAGQKFLITELSDGTYKIGTGPTVGMKVLSAYDSIYQQNYSGNTNQKWTITSNSDSSFSFINSQSGKYLTYDKNNKITEQTKNNSSYQKFVLNKFSEKFTVVFKDGYRQGSEGTISRQLIKKGEAATAPKIPTRSGYTFKNWDVSFDNVTQNITVTAQWTKNTTASYTVTFVDGTGKTLKTQIVTSGGNATAPTTPTRTGYTFTGWDKGYTNVKANTTVTAKWRANVLTINYYAGSATGDSNKAWTNTSNNLMRTNTYNYNGTDFAAYGLPNTDGGTWNLTQTGYSPTANFLIGSASSTKKISQNTKYATVQDMAKAAGVDLSTGDKILNLYAEMTPKTIKVTFDKNDGTSATYNETYTYGKTGQSFGMNLTSKTGSFGSWIRNGYTLLGWSFDKNATSAAYSIYSGVSDSWINTNAGNKTLYAIWKSNQSVATDIKDGWYVIKPTLDTSYAIDVAGNGSGNNTNVTLYKVNDSDAQKFYIHKIDNETWNIMTGTPGYTGSLDIVNGKANGNLQQYTYTGANAQKWKIIKNSDGSYTFYNKSTGNVLDIEGDDNLINGKNLWDYAYLNGNDKGQSFTLTPTSEPSSVAGKKKLVFKGTNQVVNVSGGSILDGANIIAYVNEELNNAKWALEKVSDNTYHIRSLVSDRYLLDNGSKVVQSRGTSTSFRWQTVWNGDGSVSFKNVGTGKYLYASSTNNSTVLTTNTSNSDNKAKFTLPSTTDTQVIANGTYLIKSSGGMYLTSEYNNQSNGTKIAGATTYTDQKKGMRLFKVTYLGDGLYNFATGSSIFKSNIDLPNGETTVGTVPQQYIINGANAQKLRVYGINNFRIGKDGNVIQTTTDTDPVKLVAPADNNAQKFNFTKSDGFLIQDSFKYYFPNDGTKPQIGIDVSKWQGNIDWAKVKATGKVDFAIIRMLDHSSTSTTGVDAYALANIKGCIANNIPYGVYWYSMATTTSGLKSEMDTLIKALGNYKPPKGVWYDVEATSTYASAWGSSYNTNGTGKTQLTALINYAKSYLSGKGYEPGIYLNPAQITCVNPASFGIKWWVPRYFTNSMSDTNILPLSSTYKGAYMWQYADTYTLNGISNAKVDVDCMLYNDNYVWNSSSLVKNEYVANNAATTHTVTFVDGSGNTLKTEAVLDGGSATAPTPTKTGYTFAGWDKSFTNVTSNITVTAKWTPKTVKVVFHYNTPSDDGTYSETYTYGISGQAFGMNLSAKPADFGYWSRSGYTLLGWAHEKNATSTAYPIYCGVVDSWINDRAGTVDLYAIWKNNNPSAKSGWVQEDNSWYYYENGNKLTGWQQIGGNTGRDNGDTLHYSYFGNDGKLVTGWFTADSGYENLRYADANGWVYGAAGWKANVATKPTVGATVYSDGSTSETLHGSYYFNETGELVQVIYDDFTHLNQRSYFATTSTNYGMACGPVSGLMAANMMGKLKNYVGSTYTTAAQTASARYTASASFREYMTKWQYITGDSTVGRTGGNGVWNYQIKNTLKYLGVNTEYMEDNTMYSSARLQGILTWGRVAIPFTNVKLDGSYAKHFMVVNGWRINNGAVQYHVVDPYGTTKLNPNCAGQNDGWYSVDGMNSITYKGSAKASGSESSKAIRNFTTVGTRMRFAF